LPTAARLATRAPAAADGGARVGAYVRDMVIKLNRAAFEHALQLIRAGRFVIDSRDEWSEARPSPADEERFFDEHGYREYRNWYLGIDVNEDEESRARYKFPFGDFARVHRGGVLAVEARAGQYKYVDVERAAAQLHGLLEAMAAQPHPPSR
jgi:hypothetical protein